MKRIMKRAALMLTTVCLALVCVPALADEEGVSVGEPGAFVNNQATTEVRVLAIASLSLDVTQDFAASIDEIAGNEAFDLKAVATGAGPFTYAWSRAVVASDGSVGEAVPIEGAAEAVYPLSKHTDTLTNNTEYIYTVRVVDVRGTAQEASVHVSVSDGYCARALPNDQAAPRVEGLSIHEASVLDVVEMSDASAAHGALQQAASGARLDACAWQISLTNPDAGKAPFAGTLTVTLPVETSFVPAGATSVRVVGLGATGAVAEYEALVDADAATASFTADALGVFAVAYPVDADDLFEVEATAGEGGSITPCGTSVFARGSKAVYTVLPDAGYVADKVLVDDTPVNLTGNTFTLDAIDAHHAVSASFKKVVPSDPPRSFTVSALVSGGHGRVALGSGTAGMVESAKASEGDALTVRFVPDAGYALDAVTVKTGEGSPEPVRVFGESFLVSAVTADTEITATFRSGAAAPVLVHTVSATSEGAGNVSPASQKVPHAGGAEVSLRADAGWQLASVTLNGRDVTARVDATGALSVQNVVEDMNVHAVFEKIPRTFLVSAVAGTGGTVAPHAVSVVEGESATFTVVPDAGYEIDEAFVGDELAEVADGQLVVENVHADVVVSVTFRKVTPEPPQTFTVSVSVSGGGGAALPATSEVDAGGSKTIAFAPEPGYEVERMQVNGVTYPVRGTSFTLTDIREDKRVVVFFKKLDVVDTDKPLVSVSVDVEVKAEVGDGGEVEPSGTFVMASGASQVFYAYPEPGFALQEVVVNGESVPFYGLADEGAAAAARAASARSAVPAALRAFFRASEPAGPAYAAYWFLVDSMADDSSVVVSFRPLEVGEEQLPAPSTHKVEAGASAGGGISPAGSLTVPDHGCVNYTVYAEEGHYLESLTLTGAGWSLDVTDQVKDGVFVLADVQEDVALRAQFKAERPYVINSRVEGGHGEVSPAGEVAVNEGANPVFYFLPDAGYRVSSVVVDGEELAYLTESYTFADVREDHELTVTFSPLPVPGFPASPLTPADPVALDPDRKVLAGSSGMVAKTGDEPLGAAVVLVALVAAGTAALASRQKTRRGR